MKVSDFTKGTNPVNGKELNILQPMTIVNGIIGVVLFLFVFAMGENLARAISGKFPKIDTSPEPVFSNPVTGTRDVIL